MMNADASGLAALTVLRAGTFTAGVHIRAWRICLVRIVLALAVLGHRMARAISAASLVACGRPCGAHRTISVAFQTGQQTRPTRATVCRDVLSASRRNALSRIYSFERTSAENSDYRRFYIDLMRRDVEDALGVYCAGESTNVTQVFQPSGRLALSNSL